MRPVSHTQYLNQCIFHSSCFTWRQKKKKNPDDCWCRDQTHVWYPQSSIRENTVTISKYTFRSSTWPMWVEQSCAGRDYWKMGVVSNFNPHCYFWNANTFCAHTALRIVSCHHPHILITPSTHTVYRRHCVQQVTGPMLPSLFLSLLVYVKYRLAER